MIVYCINGYAYLVKTIKDFAILPLVPRRPLFGSLKTRVAKIKFLKST